jgi:hypothetical protein
MQDGGGELTARLARLFGNVDVEILEVEAGGRVEHVTPGRAAYVLERGAYVNPGLDLRIQADGWTVEDADSTWPSSLVVAFRRGEERVELHEVPAAPASRSLATLGSMFAEGRAVLVAPRGGTLWLYSARGPRPEQSLRALLSAVRTGA